MAVSTEKMSRSKIQHFLQFLILSTGSRMLPTKHEISRSRNLAENVKKKHFSRNKENFGKCVSRNISFPP